ncbi:MAG TPA: holo-ACP synthase [Pyrinomonadaceae bacterium]
MIVSIGIDIVEVYRIRQTIERTPRFVVRVFTEQERAYCEGKGVVAAQHYAARFAAKEAALKALRTGWRGAVGWQDIEVIGDENGAPRLEIRGGAKQIFDSLGATRAHLSLSHTTEHAIAQVIFER